MNLSVQPPVGDRTEQKTDETLVKEDTEAIERLDRMRSALAFGNAKGERSLLASLSKNLTKEIPAPKALLPPF